MTIVVDPGRGALADGLGNIATAIANRINEVKIRENEFRNNPEALAGLASAARAAGPSGLDSLASSLRVSREFLETTSAGFAPTSAEITERESIKHNLPQALVQKAILQTGGDIEGLQTLSDAGFFSMDAGRQIAESGAATATALYENELMTLTRESGGAGIKVNADNWNNRLVGRMSEQQLDQLNRAMQTINSIDQSTPEGRHLAFMAASFINEDTSRFANYLAQQERLDFSLRASKGNQTPQEKFALTMEVQGELKDAAEYLRVLEDDKESDPDALNAARALLENVKNAAMELTADGVIMDLDLVGAISTRGGKSTEFTVQGVTSPLINELAGLINSGEMTLEEFKNEVDHEASMSSLVTDRDKAAYQNLMAQVDSNIASVATEAEIVKTTDERVAETNAQIQRLIRRREEIAADGSISATLKSRRIQDITTLLRHLQQSMQIIQYESQRDLGKNTDQTPRIGGGG